MSIHYAHDVNRKHAKTACGHVFDMCSAGECLTNDTESIDCEECLASDEFKAQSMEQVLTTPAHDDDDDDTPNAPPEADSYWLSDECNEDP